MGIVLEIWVSPETGGDNESRDSVHAVAGEGLEGDRYRGSGRPDQEITLIELEQLQWFEREHGLPFPTAQTRRNIVISGLPLNDLVRQRLRIGEVVLEGKRLCQPCRTLQERTGLPVLPAMIDRSGLNCRIVTSGEIRIGDPVEPIKDNDRG